MTNIVVWSAFRTSADAVSAQFPDDRVIGIADEKGLGAAADAEVAFSGNNPRRVRQLLDATPKLRWYHTVSAGVENMPLLELAQRGIVLTNNSGSYDVQIAEHLMMFVIGVRRKAASREPGVERVVSAEQLADVVGEADYLAITAPLTPATRGAISREVISRMKPTGWIVNIARGAIVDEDAMVAALRENRIAGAGLDVFATEPLPADHPLWTMDNVVITPHSSGDSPRVGERTIALFTENLRRYKAGEPLINRVDYEAGY